LERVQGRVDRAVDLPNDPLAIDSVGDCLTDEFAARVAALQCRMSVWSELEVEVLDDRR
jgi:hypothetical protein